jgi:hypothetical protein
MATLACTLVTEGTITDTDRLVREDRPALVLLAPVTGNVYAAGTEVTLHAIATDIEGTVSRIEFIIDLPGEEKVLVYPSDNPEGEPSLEAVVTWEAFGNQTYIVHAHAYRAAGDPNDPVDDIPSNEGLTSITVIDPSSTGPIPDTPPVDETPEVTENAPTDDSTIDLDSLQVIVASVSAIAAPVRQGPGVTYNLIQNLSQGTMIEVVGRSEDLVWFAIRLDNGVGWVFTDVIDFPGSINDLPVINAPEQ